MLKLAGIEFFTRVIPEMLIFVWGIYVVSKKEIHLGKYLLATMIMSTFTFVDRMLPIHYGVHTIIDNVFYIIISIIIIDITLTKSIYSIFFITILLCISEISNVMLLNMMHINIINISQNPLRKSILGIPSLVVLIGLIILTKYILERKKI